MLDKKYENMSLYYDGELTGDELTAFETKLFENTEFAQEYTNYAEFLEMVINTPMAEPPQNLRANIMKRVREEARPIELIGEKVAAKPKRRGLPSLFPTKAIQSLLLNENIKPKSFQRFGYAAAAVVACVIVLGTGLSLLDSGGQMQFATAPAPAAAPVPMSAAGEAAPWSEAIHDDHDGEQGFGIAEPSAAARTNGIRNETGVFAAPNIAQQDLFADDFVIRSAHITVEVEDFDTAIHAVNMLSGHNENVSIGSGETSSAWITRRVPIEQYNESLHVLRNLGRVTSEREHTDNVGASITSAQARSSALNHEIARLFTYLEQSETVSDLTLISARIGRIEQESIDASRQVHQLTRAVAQPNLDITIIEVDTTEIQPASFLDNVSGGFIGSLHFISNAFTGLIVLIARFALPTLIVTVLAFIFIRTYRGFKKPEALPKEEDTVNEA